MRGSPRNGDLTYFLELRLYFRGRAKTGLDYFYRENRYLSLSLGAATDLPLADKKSIPLNGFVKTASTFYTSLRANRVLGSFDLGYGIYQHYFSFGVAWKFPM
jgi:hypothetical protein